MSDTSTLDAVTLDAVTLDAKIPATPWGLRPYTPSSPGSLALAPSTGGEVPA